MKILALIPARGGSKGIPRKNIRMLHGKPLLAWTIEAALASETIDRIVVSTEDEEIATLAQTWGADVPFLRPAELAQDDTPSILAALHTLAELSEFDWMLLLQPTSPMRNSADIDGIVRFCLQRGAASSASVCEVTKNPYWMFLQGGDYCLHPFVENVQSVTRRQDLPTVYALNGALYLAQRDWLIYEKRFVGTGTIGYRMPVERSVDIDSLLDWDWVEFMMRKQFILNEPNYPS